MRLLCVLSAVIFLISITGCQTGPSSSAALFLIASTDYQKPSDTDKQIIKSLNEINKKLSILNKQLKERKDDTEDVDVPLTGIQPNYNTKGPNVRRLKKIKLAKNPSREQVKEYIERIITATRGQNTYSSTDPQVSMLRKINSKNVDLLLDYAQNLYVQYALPHIAKEKNKEQVLEALKVYPQLITCVDKNNWSKDAKETIFESLDNKGAYLPHEFITVAVQLASPKEYAVLEKYFISGNNLRMTYQALSQLEDFDMKTAVAKAWKHQSKAGPPWAKKQMAMLAARFGHKDALQYLVLAYRRENNQHSMGQIRASLYRLTGKTFSPKKMSKWYKENESKLVFDSENEEYVKKAKVKTK